MKKLISFILLAFFFGEAMMFFFLSLLFAIYLWQAGNMEWAFFAGVAVHIVVLILIVGWACSRVWDKI